MCFLLLLNDFIHFSINVKCSFNEFLSVCFLKMVTCNKRLVVFELYCFLSREAVCLCFKCGESLKFLKLVFKPSTH